MVQNVIFHPGHVCDPTARSEMCPVIHLGTLILCYGYVLLFMLKIFRKKKKSNVPEPPPVPFLSSFYLHKHKCTDLHNRTGTYTQAQHPSHVISLGIMPMAKHVTYQKSLWDIARERGGVVVVCVCVCVGEILHICQFLRAPCQV